ncbi:hypothetical protein GUJ93_ZPchr0001g31804 [Zizania palustris]|uniref:Uncharacterized protein n=1 Tax=Zizania palustris TaxID=103762 RepID=A0A8J5UZM3_ZIZPA|nr:hypothetical protein GUJ93_ZPchr0001g31804 [Zizania palustris]
MVWCSSVVCEKINKEGGLKLLIDIVKDPNTPEEQLEKIINMISRIFDIGVSLIAMPDSCAHSDGSEDATYAEKKTQSDIDGEKTNGTSFTYLNQEISSVPLIDFDVISRLTKVLMEASPNLQEKVASILDHLAAFDEHATAMTAACIGSVIEAVLEMGVIHGKMGDPENFEEPPTAVVAQSKDWLGACLIKLQSTAALSGYETVSRVDMEITIYETIPRLVEQMMTSFSFEAKRNAVIELNKIISGGVMECTRAVATAGGIFPLVKMIEEGDGDVLEASLAVLYNLSMDPENHPAIIAAGAVPLLKRIVVAESSHWNRSSVTELCYKVKITAEVQS